MSRWRTSVAAGAARRFQVSQAAPIPRASGSVDVEARRLLRELVAALANPGDFRERERLALLADILVGVGQPEEPSS